MQEPAAESTAVEEEDDTGSVAGKALSLLNKWMLGLRAFWEIAGAVSNQAAVT